MSEITAERVRDLLDYCAEDGNFRWRSAHKRANAGSIAGQLRPNGYRCIAIDGTRYLAHRLVWLHCFGEIPVGFVDHINRDRSDNRLENLRLCSHSQNCRNRPGAAGEGCIKGVSWHRQRQKWQAQIKVDGRNRYLGLFSTKEQAAAAYDAAASVEHGDFAYLNSGRAAA